MALSRRSALYRCCLTGFVGLCLLTSGCSKIKKVFHGDSAIEDVPQAAVSASDPQTESDSEQTDSTDATQRPLGEGSPSTSLDRVHFEYDSYQLTPKTLEALQANLKWIQAHTDVSILIEGHCDERGTTEYNLMLGERRADSVKQFFISRGIDPQRLYTISYGEERPLDTDYGEQAWWKNRRVEFKQYE